MNREKTLEIALQKVLDIATGKRQINWAFNDIRTICREALTEDREVFVIQNKYDNKYYHAIWLNSRDNEESIRFANQIEYAKVFYSKEDEEYKKVINIIGEEGYDYILINLNLK